MADHAIRVLAVTLASVALGALMVPGATAVAATEVTRTSYREAVEPICQADTERNERILVGVRGEVRSGLMKPAADKFSKAARALKSAVAELRAVAPPPADAARLSRWLDKLAHEVGFLERIAAKLRVGDKPRAERLVVKLTTEANAANNVAIPFGFRACRSEPSRFT